MDLIVLLISSIIILIILAVLLRFNGKNIKSIKSIGCDKRLNEITNKLPENEYVCREILKMIKNENVKIKVGNENSQSSLYIVATNSILIANIKNTFIRIQTIAHECIHSIQDKRLLWFNFIFSNIYLIYFTIITILALFNKLANPSIYSNILVMMSVLAYFVRSYIETDAMIRARFLAKEYLARKIDCVSENEVDTIVSNYDRLNEIGVKFYNFKLLFDYVVKIVVFLVVAIWGCK